jgi:hypothetical protein
VLAHSGRHPLSWCARQGGGSGPVYEVTGGRRVERMPGWWGRATGSAPRRLFVTDDRRGGAVRGRGADTAGAATVTGPARSRSVRAQALHRQAAEQIPSQATSSQARALSTVPSKQRARRRQRPSWAKAFSARQSIAIGAKPTDPAGWALTFPPPSPWSQLRGHSGPTMTKQESARAPVSSAGARDAGPVEHDTLQTGKNLGAVRTIGP